MNHEPKQGEKSKGKKNWRQIAVTGTKLKIYACISMVLYSISVSVIQNGLIKINQYSSQDELKSALAVNPDLMIISSWASILKILGGLSVPVFAFLLVEGFLKTGSFKRYFLTMLIFAVISEVPYDFAMYGKFFDLTMQNPLFTLTICLIMLYGLRMFDKGKGAMHRFVQIMIVLSTLLWVSLIRGDIGLCTVVLTAIYYLLREHKGTRLLLGSMISIMYISGPLSVYPLFMYNGQRGWNKNKYLFYIFYPLHLLLLGVIAYFL